MTLYGMRVYVSEWYVTPTWVFPQHQFFEWEAKDEKSCRTMNIGHEGPSRPAAFCFGDCLYVHPTIYAELQKHCQVPEPTPFGKGTMPYFPPHFAGGCVALNS